MKRIEGLMAKELGECRVLVIKGLNVAGAFTVNVTGETLVLKKYFVGFLLGKSLLYAGKIPIFQTFPA